MVIPGTLTRGEAFSRLTLEGFAPGHRHAFVLKGTGGAVLFKPQPVPREAIVAAIGLPRATLHLARQVHGASVVERPGPAPLSPDAGPPEADALVTRTRSHAVCVATADCLPILLASGDGACAAVHAGWRGLLAGVIEAAIAELGGGADLQAAIGPAIGPCCFEVGLEVVPAFTQRFPAEGGFARGASAAGGCGKAFIDLPAAARAVLTEQGLSVSRVHGAGLCTRCGPPDLLESYRRDGTAAGRMIAVIGRA